MINKLVAIVHLLSSLLVDIWFILNGISPNISAVVFPENPVGHTLSWLTILSFISLIAYLVALIANKKYSRNWFIFLLTLIPFLYSVATVIDIYRFGLSIKSVFDFNQPAIFKI